MTRRPVALFVLAMALAAMRAAPAADYEIEVIVFRHAGAGAEDRSPSGTLAVPPVGQALAEPDPALPVPAAFSRLPPTMWRLSGAARRLSGSAAYEVLVHEAWRQPGEAHVPVRLADAMPVPDAPDSGSAGVPPPQPRVEGSVLLAQAGPRLRVVTDFLVRVGEQAVRVQDARSVRTGDLNYLDHELLGILLQVTEVLPPAEASATEDSATGRVGDRAADEPQH